MIEEKVQKIDMELVRQKLEGTTGKQYWRSLEEVAETPEFEAWLEDEFPNRRSIVDINRRSFIKFMGASFALAGLSGCRSLRLPSEKLVPYVNVPDGMTPGKPMHFATVFAHNGSALGLLVESHEGRPTKIEGNPSHPESKGATDHFAQAELLTLYDPDRLRTVRKSNMISTWDLFLSAARAAMDEEKATGGAGLFILTSGANSPTVERLLAKIKTNFPNSTRADFEVVNNSAELQGTTMALGTPACAKYSLENAKVILSLDADYLFSMPDSVTNTRGAMERRRVRGKDVSKMSRTYVVESTTSTTGAMADHRLALRPELVEGFARAVAAKFGVTSGPTASAGAHTKWLDAVVADLQAAGSEAVVIAGQTSSPAIHAVAAAINAKLKSTAVRYIASPTPIAVGLDDLAAALKAGKVKNLVILGGNPVFEAPGTWNLADLIAKVPFSVHHTLYANETSKACKWATGASHFLESWTDATTRAGTTSLGQPLIAPMSDTKSPVEFLARLLSDARSGMEIVRETHSASDAQWREWLHKGVAKESSAVVPMVEKTISLPPAPRATGTSLVFAPDPTIWDGRYANNGWLQELPKVMTTLTWDNAALLPPKMAEELGISFNKPGEHVKISVNGASITIPAIVNVGQPEDTITLHYGYGRTEVGTVGSGAGTNVFGLRKDTESHMATGATIEKVSGSTVLALTQTHHTMEGRDIVKDTTVDEFLANPKLWTEGDELGKKAVEGREMWPSYKTEYPFDGPQWGLSIDLNLCTGCHACVTACVAENNIPVVGKDQVHKGREMHWIRIDRYYRAKGHLEEEDKRGPLSRNNELTNSRDIIDPSEGKRDILDPNKIETIFAPVACMHCEKAPCEPVCPVAATVHSHEGLNQMVYNRCVGTRYCSNNCPYKVRRFNYLNYTDNQAQFMERTEVAHIVTSTEKTDGRNYLRMINNPDVTVRGRGVMEKCTYCVQRINKSRIAAKKEKREIRDGEVVTACQQACPAGAISFGNINDPKSEVSLQKADIRSYLMLPELNTRNRTTYMARLRNPNKALENA